MKLLTRQILASSAAERWREQFTDGPQWRFGHSKQEVYEALVSLGARPHPDDVDRVIRNGSWTNPVECFECGKPSSVIVEIGEESDYESSTTWVCPMCLQAALDMVIDNA